MAPGKYEQTPQRNRTTPQNIEASDSSGSSKPQRPVMTNPRKIVAKDSSSDSSFESQRASSKNTSEADSSSGSSAKPPSSANQRKQLINPGLSQPAPSASSTNRNLVIPREPWRDWQQLPVTLTGIPTNWETVDIYKLFESRQAIPARIDMADRKPGTAKVIFRPPPAPTATWVYAGFDINAGSRGRRHITCRLPHSDCANEPQHFNELSINGLSLEFGVMKDEQTMLSMRSVSNPQPRLVIDRHKQQLSLHFGMLCGPEGRKTQRSFIFRVPLTQIRSFNEHFDEQCRLCFVIVLDAPPLAFRKTSKVWETHDTGSKIWDERQIWYRQVSIETDPTSANVAAKTTQLQNEHSSIDIGRWLAYRFVCDPMTSPVVLSQLRVDLGRNNINIRPQSVRCIPTTPSIHWQWLGSSSTDAMSSDTVHLPFDLRYQVEACISYGNFHESNLDATWAKRLMEMDNMFQIPGTTIRHRRSTKLLEKVLESKQRFDKPMDIFKLQGRVNLMQKKIPRYCTMVRSATVTPTTIYFNSPSMDTSNRVIRRYRDHEDRFLRVKFRDESYKGTIMAFDDDTTDELFTRVKRTMKNGIVVGDRHYEFLAYGNSQFREHGAYFFAPTSTLTSDMIRAWMGNFESIKVVAKYASRIGQCFSTTRAMANGLTVNRIADIERNGFCFTDGVGKISTFLAQMTAQEMGLSSSAKDCPSVLQFRLGGSKGVLTIDPTLKGSIVELRPSQEKFPATYRGLEICRVSQFATAYLNQQIVLVLSALGVPDEVFLVKLRKMLENLERAMDNESMALDLLQKNIDVNQTTVQIASIILDGSMRAKDPFLITCMRLWRAWSIKYLKEKAKIFVEQGAFVLGCVDETGILKGHSNGAPVSDTTHDISALPEIFLQIPDPGIKGKYKIIEGVCALARNPSLHPGDCRVVSAVDVPQLHHLRNCVVLPQTGDRDLAGMCSGGDLDGDDYLVMWDSELLPREWNHAPMDYTAPSPVLSNGPVTVDAMTSFFVTHMKNDNLGRIATAHRYWADCFEEGVKHERCLALAALHSKAVDYAKTGEPAEMPKEMRVRKRPHWAGKDGDFYRSRKILGKLYDEVVRVPFVPAWELPFDQRVLTACELDNAVLSLAADVKREYDEAIRRLMRQHAIQSEFEVWTTFVMSHNGESRDFQFAEELGETMAGIKQQFRTLCYEKAGTTSTERDSVKMKPFIVAMYTVTAQEMAQANAECQQTKFVAGRPVAVRLRTSDSMPLMSFPWIFQRDLGQIATRRYGGRSSSIVSMPPLEPAKTLSDSTRSPEGKVDAFSDRHVVPVKERADSKDLIDFDEDEKQSLSMLPNQPKDKGHDEDASLLKTKGGDMHSGASSNDENKQIRKSLLLECSAFEASDRAAIDKGLQSIESMAAEPSRKYENNPGLVPSGNVSKNGGSKESEAISAELSVRQENESIAESSQEVAKGGGPEGEDESGEIVVPPLQTGSFAMSALDKLAVMHD